jgi:hypothetical protein
MSFDGSNIQNVSSKMYVDVLCDDRHLDRHLSPGQSIIICTLNRKPSGTSNQQVRSLSLFYTLIIDSKLFASLSGGLLPFQRAETCSLFRVSLLGYTLVYPLATRTSHKRFVLSIFCPFGTHADFH